MSVFTGSVEKERVYALMPTGEYVATLLDLTLETEGAYGDSLLWKWMLAVKESPTDYICRDDGQERVQHEYTPTDITLGSKSHEWIAALTERTLSPGDTPPDADDLIGRRMLVYITHQAPRQGPNKGKLRERFTQGSAKPLTLAPPRPTARNVPAASAPPADDDRAALVARIEKLIGRAVKLETPHHQKYVAVDLSEAHSTADLAMLENTIREEVQAALDS